MKALHIGKFLRYLTLSGIALGITVAMLPELPAYSQSGALFQDTFESYSIGSNGSPNWSVLTGQARVASDGGNNVYWVTPTGAGPTVRTSQVWGADYVLEFRAKSISSSPVSVIFRGLDSGNYCCVIGQAGTVNYEEHRNASNTASANLGSYYQVCDGAWHQWRIKVQGSECQVDIDNGGFTGTYQSLGIAGGSYWIGFGPKSGDVYYDDVAVWSLDGFDNRDSDGDGLTDVYERTVSMTDPYKADTDSDGVPDGTDPYPLAVDTTNPQPTVEIKSLNGSPALFVDGNAMGPMCFHWSDTSLANTTRVTDAGFKIFFVIHNPGSAWTWPYFGGYSALDYSISQLLAANPNAYIVLRSSYGTTPSSWAISHQDQVFKDYTGTVLSSYSFASDLWKEDVGHSIITLVNHIRSSSYSSRVLGMLVCAGSTDEWGQWESDFDYSPAMDKYLRQWLKQKYSGDVSALRTAWNDNTLTFDNVRVPAHSEGWNYTFGPFMNPLVTKKGQDYYHAHNAVVADKIAYLAKILKKASKGKWLVGCFYGGMTETHYLLSGTSALRETLDCPDVDFLAGPYQYENRGLGDNCDHRGVAASLKMRNKLWFCEDDTRLWLDDPILGKQTGRPDTEAGTVELLKRDYCASLAGGAYGWTGIDLGSTPQAYFDSSTIMNTHARLQAIGESSLNNDRSQPREIAMVVDEESLFLTHQAYSWWAIHREKIHELGRIGAPYDFLLLDDLAKASTPDYKMYIFLNAFSLTNQKRSWIDQKVKKNGATAVWIYAPGLINEDNASAPVSTSYMSALTGITLAYQSVTLSTEIKTTNNTNLITSQLGLNHYFCQFYRPITTGFSVLPPNYSPYQPEAVTSYGKLFYVNDPSATALGVYVNSTSKVAFAVKEFPTWRSVFIGSVAVNSEVLRAIARVAGVHIYDDGDDVVYVNGSYIAVHTANGGSRTIRLPFSANVYDVFNGDAVIGSGVTQFQVNLLPYSTNLYRFSGKSGWNRWNSGPFFTDPNTVALWHMDNPTPLADSSSYGNNLAVTGGSPVLGTGRYYEAYAFHGLGVNDRLLANDSASLESLSMASQQSYEASFKLNRLPYQDGSEPQGFMLFMRGWGCFIRVESTGILTFRMGEPGAYQTIQTNLQPTPGVWNHVAMTFSDGVMKVWMNGVQYPTTAAFTPTISSAYGVSIGSLPWDGAGGTTDGIIDEVRFSAVDRSSLGLKGTLAGHVTLEDFVANSSPVAVKVELIQNSIVVRTETVVLDGSGNFSLSVDSDTYDVAVKASSWLRKVVPGVLVPGGGVGTIDIILVNGDSDGDNAITHTDQGVVLGNLDQKGD